MDNESIEDINMSASRENITIAEDTNDDSIMTASTRRGVRHHSSGLKLLSSGD
jgi:hypothetical protein